MANQAKKPKDEKRLYNQNLIEFVRSNPILFDTRSDDYKNNTKKSLLWNQFGQIQFPKEDGLYFNLKRSESFIDYPF